eukprot:2123565-Karenia_brevis.AAC.1
MNSAAMLRFYRAHQTECDLLDASLQMHDTKCTLAKYTEGIVAPSCWEWQSIAGGLKEHAK